MLPSSGYKTKCRFAKSWAAPISIFFLMQVKHKEEKKITRNKLEEKKDMELKEENILNK